MWRGGGRVTVTVRMTHRTALFCRSAVGFRPLSARRLLGELSVYDDLPDGSRLVWHSGWEAHRSGRCFSTQQVYEVTQPVPSRSRRVTGPQSGPSTAASNTVPVRAKYGQARGVVPLDLHRGRRRVGVELDVVAIDHAYPERANACIRLALLRHSVDTCQQNPPPRAGQGLDVAGAARVRIRCSQRSAAPATWRARCSPGSGLLRPTMSSRTPRPRCTAVSLRRSWTLPLGVDRADHFVFRPLRDLSVPALTMSVVTVPD